jgi:protein-L-isoaspartate(D-aspartate) O-methyltransferase
MITSLRAAGIVRAEVLQAMAMVPRHFFVDSALARDAYRMQALPLSVTDWREQPQTISHPLTVAMQTQILMPQADDKILEIGTGSGYQTAVLCAMGVRHVFSIERQQSLHVFAKNILSEMGWHPTLVFGDGFEGLPQYAPFNKIIVTCGAAAVPPKLVEQLARDGLMLIPIRRSAEHLLIAMEHTINGIKATNHGRCRGFVPMLSETKQKK